MLNGEKGDGHQGRVQGRNWRDVGQTIQNPFSSEGECFKRAIIPCYDYS